MKDITTLLFDIDGTILDTREFILQATEYALSGLGFPVPERSVITKFVGIPFPGYYLKLGASLEDTDKLVEKHREFQYSNFNLAILFPNAIETLKILKEKGYKLAAVTSRSKKTSHQTLVDAGIFDLFDIVISFEDAKELKPHPAPLLKALEHLKEMPKNAVMIGDSNLDIEAGKNAGTKTIRATYGFHSDNLRNPEPDFFIKDIKELLDLL
ncbi:MAG: HAD-IIIA family hydrolase [Candidatus Taylorbacteria bacterium]|nr:HAD-IIIA family hydrolase [Candidatus Taylorbacteria bacterium]